MPPVSAAVAAELAKQGVGCVFGLVGEDNVEVASALEGHGIQYYGARHESVAVAMADGYARVSGELGVALISRGPGVTNALTGLVTAAKARNPIVILAGDTDPAIRGTVYSKAVDQAAIFDGAGIPFVTIDDPESAVADLTAVIERARTGRLVVANFRGKVLEHEAGVAPSRASLPPPVAPAGEPSSAQVAELADLIAESWAFKRPVILGGRGAVGADARVALERLGARCGALMATTVMAKSLFHGNAFDVGVAGTYALEPALELLPQADLVLAFGATLDQFTTLRGALFPNAHVVQVDRDATVAGRASIEVALFVEGDVRATATALADELERRSHQATGYRTAETAERIASYHLESTIRDAGSPGALDPRMVMIKLDALLPAERTVVIDNGHHTAFPTWHLSVPDPSAFVSPLEFHCVGAATGMAFGAAVARPDRLMVYDVGDGGLMMTLGDLESFARYKIPALIVVSNDQALGAEVHFLRALGLPDAIAHCPAPSFAEVGRAMGIESRAIETLDDLDAVGEWVGQLSGPLLLDVPLTTDVRADWVEFVMLPNRVASAAGFPAAQTAPSPVTDHAVTGR
jgi:thiamine pyrophosphate-dependent acetolactate synthase large subunit-like protein